MYLFYKYMKLLNILIYKKYAIDFDQIPEEAPKKLENQKKAISWRRIARAIEKNDFYLKRLSFAQTKTEEDELRELAHKWDNLISKDTKTTDVHLNKVIKEEFINNDSGDK